MSAELRLTAPSDLVIGTLTIAQQADLSKQWVAMGGEMQTFSGLHAGACQVEITPTGGGGQTVVFILQEGINQLHLPDYSKLLHAGGNLHSLDREGDLLRAHHDREIYDRLYASVRRHTTDKAADDADADADADSDADLWMDTDSDADTDSGTEQSQPAARSTANLKPSLFSLRHHLLPDGEDIGQPQSARTISLGVACVPNTATRGQYYHPYQPEVRARYLGGDVELLFSSHSQQKKSYTPVRLTLSVAGLPLRHCLLPQYPGGTRVLVKASRWSAGETELSILPQDHLNQAMLQVLESGSLAEAQALKYGISQTPFFPDPWRALIASLLCLRYPEVFESSLLEEMATTFSGLEGLHDVQVILAAVYLQKAEQAGDSQLEKYKMPVLQMNAINKSISALKAALACSSPCFSYSNQLFGQLLHSIQSWIRYYRRALPGSMISNLNWLEASWQRKQILQYTGTTHYMWHDGKNLPATGRLNDRYEAILFTGEVNGKNISVEEKERWVQWPTFTLPDKPQLLLSRRPKLLPK